MYIFDRTAMDPYTCMRNVGYDFCLSEYHALTHAHIIRVQFLFLVYCGDEHSCINNNEKSNVRFLD